MFRYGSIASSLTSLRQSPVWEQSRKWRWPVWARRRRASAHPAASWLRQNNATGKIPLSPSGKSALPARPILSRQEGRSRVVTNVGEDAVDAAASARVCSQGGLPCADDSAQDERRQSVRQNRVVPTPVAGVKLPVATSIQPDRPAIEPAATVTRQNSSPRRS